ncbi:hypothetical protein HDV00_001634 [Rhizophlyctis rosea]|nr:hypothetical protein HDV00_001634 [Rhizophlyctis rosea]
MRHNDFECFVVVDDQHLEEHHHRKKGPHAKCRIAAEDRKQYSLKLINHARETNPHESFLAHLLIDGMLSVDGSVIIDTAILPYEEPRMISGRQFGNNMLQPFMFNIQGPETDKENSKPRIGEIYVEMRRVKLVKHVESYEPENENDGIDSDAEDVLDPDDVPLSERVAAMTAAKNTSMQVSFGEATQVDTRTETYHFKEIDPECYASFTFRYQNEDVPQARANIASDGDENEEESLTGQNLQKGKGKADNDDENDLHSSISTPINGTPGTKRKRTTDEDKEENDRTPQNSPSLSDEGANGGKSRHDGGGNDLRTPSPTPVDHTPKTSRKCGLDYKDDEVDLTPSAGNSPTRSTAKKRKSRMTFEDGDGGDEDEEYEEPLTRTPKRVRFVPEVQEQGVQEQEPTTPILRPAPPAKNTPVSPKSKMALKEMGSCTSL